LGHRLRAAVMIMGASASVIAPAVSAQDNAAPMSAIDWLSEQAVLPDGFLVIDPATGLPKGLGDAVSNGASAPTVTATPLDVAGPDGAGLLPPEITGLPASLWSNSRMGDLISALQAVPMDLPPGAHDLLFRVLLAEADPPAGADGRGLWLGARADALLDRGAVDQALALVEASAPASPALFGRWFEAATLLDLDAAPCAALRRSTTLSADARVRAFCFARGGDWTAAALTVQTGAALGDLSDADADLLTAFLDPALAEELTLAAPGPTMDIIEFRLRSAIGMPVPAANLPLRFAATDLNPDAPWRAQLEAVERLAKVGALPVSTVFSVYTARVPAASGTIWDRVTAIQALDAAVTAGDGAAIDAALPDAWTAAQDGGFPAAFAEWLMPRVQSPDTLSDVSRTLLGRLGYLTTAYEAHAAGLGQSHPDLAAIATGTPDASGSATPSDKLLQLRDIGQTGEAILLALTQIGQGQDGDPAQMERGIAGLRALGLEDFARRVALSEAVLK